MQDDSENLKKGENHSDDHHDSPDHNITITSFEKYLKGEYESFKEAFKMKPTVKSKPLNLDYSHYYKIF